PHVRRYHRSDCGRLVAAVLELSRARQLLLASVYMPSGLDHTAAGSDTHQQAHRLYEELQKWCVGMHEIVVMGDLNQTLTRWDRQPHTAIASASPASPIAHLRDDGFTDIYRHLHPNAL